MENKEQNYQLILRVGYFLALGYFVYLIYGAVVANYRTNQEIASLKAEIDLLNSEKDYIANLNIYYATNAYKELEARRKLGMKKPDEKIVHVPIDPTRLAQIENREVISQTKTTSDEASNQLSNPRKWLKFILRI